MLPRGKMPSSIRSLTVAVPAEPPCVSMRTDDPFYGGLLPPNCSRWREESFEDLHTRGSGSGYGPSRTGSSGTVWRVGDIWRSYDKRRKPDGVNQQGAGVRRKIVWLPESNTHPNTVLENRKYPRFSVPLTNGKRCRLSSDGRRMVSCRGCRIRWSNSTCY